MLVRQLRNCGEHKALLHLCPRECWRNQNLWLVVALLTALAVGTGACMHASGQAHAVSVAASEQISPVLPQYTLAPGLLHRAHGLYLWWTSLDFAIPIWGILLLIGILEFGWAARLRDFTSAIARRRWIRELIFFPLLLLLIALLELPLTALAHHVGLAYQQSVEQWPAWFVDWSKSLAIELVTGTIALFVVFALIRASTRRWWLWIWLISLPAEVLVVFILPVVINPMFYRFEPLEASHPRLVRRLEQVIAHTDVKIPPSRIFLMRASTKVTGANAYVTGFGSSKRVVIWDTTIQTCPEDEVLAIFGHELGHYVLHHIQRGMAIGAGISFFLIWLGFYIVRFFCHRFGGRWRVPSLEDRSAAAILLLVLAILSFLSEPIANGISRMQEHEADVFGQEVIHGIVPHPNLVMAQSFQRLGEQSLAYPYPNGFVVFWTYTHPPVRSREAFAAAYDPWLPGRHPRYFRKQAPELQHSQRSPSRNTGELRRRTKRLHSPQFPQS